MRRRKRKTRPDSKKRLPSLARRKKVLWELCKQITRARYIKEDGTWECYTCGSRIDVPKKAQTGHCINAAFGGIRLRFDLRNLRVQDHYCNINLGSNGAVYLMKLRDEIGDEEVYDMFNILAMKKTKLEDERAFIEDLIIKYRLILETL